MLKVRDLCAGVAMATLLCCRLYAGVGALKADTYVSTASAGTNYGAATVINVGGGNSGLLQFDLSSAASQLSTSLNTPSTVTPFIGKATLTIYVNKVTSAGTITAAPLLSAWTESAVTHSNLPLVGPVASSAAVSAGAQFVTLDVTPIVEGWLNNNNSPHSSMYVGGGNFGIYLASTDSGVISLDSKEGTTTSHVASLDIELPVDFQGVLLRYLPASNGAGGSSYVPLVSVHLTGNNTASGRILYAISATDGGNQIAAEQGVLQFVASANSITCYIQPDSKIRLGTVNSACSPSFFNPGLQPGVYIQDQISFGAAAPTTVHQVTYRIENLSGAVLRLEP